MSNTEQNGGKPALPTANAGPAPGDMPLDRALKSAPLPSYPVDRNASQPHAMAENLPDTEATAALIERLERAEAQVTMLTAQDLAMHRKLAAETLRADQGWARFDAANRAKNELEAALARAAAQKPVAQVAEDFIFILRKQSNGDRWPVGTQLYVAPMSAANIPGSLADAPGADSKAGA